MEREVVTDKLDKAQQELAEKIREIYQEITEEVLQETRDQLKNQIKALAEAELEQLLKGEKKTIFEERAQVGADDGVIAYLYCLVQHLEESSITLDEIKGLLGSSVYPVWEERIAAVVSDVPAPEFFRKNCQQDGQDPEWVAQRVQEHQDVLLCLMERATIIPVRFGTVFPDRQALINFLQVERDKIVEGLQRVEGNEEWGVQVFYRTDYREFEEKKDWKREFTKNNIASPVHAYLWRNQNVGNDSAEVEGKKRRYAQIFHDILGEEAKERQLNEPTRQQDELKGEMLLNAAYLVSKEKVELFRETIVKLEEEYQAEFSFQSSGPWPPYNFTQF